MTLWPFPVKQYQKIAETAERFLCVEMSMGQMIDDVKLAINCSKPVEFYGRTGGVIPKPRSKSMQNAQEVLNNGSCI